MELQNLFGPKPNYQANYRKNFKSDKYENFYRDLVFKNLPPKEQGNFHLSEVYQSCEELLSQEGSKNPRAVIKQALSALRLKFGTLEFATKSKRAGVYRWVGTPQKPRPKPKLNCKYCKKEYERPHVLKKHEAKCLNEEHDHIFG